LFEAELGRPPWLDRPVKIGDGRAITGPTNWAAMTHEELYTAVCGGNEPSTVYDVSDKWVSLGNNMLESANTLHQQVTASSAGWTGEAAAASRDAVSQLVGWGGSAAQTAQVMGQQLAQQGQVMETAKTNMPGPVDFDVKMAAMAQPGLAGFANAVLDTQPGQQMAAEAHARAIDVATTMEQASTQVDASTPEFQPVPLVISPNQRGTLQPFSKMQAPTAALSPEIPASPKMVDSTARTQATDGTQAQSAITPAQPPNTGAPVTGQPYGGGSGGTSTSGYQAPPPQGGYQPNSPGGYQPPAQGSPGNPGGGGGSTGWTGGSSPVQPQDIYAVPTTGTTTSSYPGPSGGSPYSSGPTGWPTGPGPQTSDPTWTNPSGGPGGSSPGGGFPGGTFPGGSFPGGSFPGGSVPKGGIPTGEFPEGGGPGGASGGTGPGGAAGGGSDSMRSYQPGAISSRLGSGATGARAAAGSASGSSESAVEAERAATGAGGPGSAAARSGSTPGMAGGGGGKRKEEDKEHKSKGYVEGDDDLFEPLGGELPPPVIGERRPKASK
jgi:hypothetical protein